MLLPHAWRICCEKALEVMKLDCLRGTGGLPILRLYDCDDDEAAQFMSAVRLLGSGREQKILVHALPYVIAINGCGLTLVQKSWDQAILKTGPVEFECGFTTATWDNIADLLEPFVDGSHGYQIISGSPGEAELLFSASGDW